MLRDRRIWKPQLRLHQLKRLVTSIKLGSQGTSVGIEGDERDHKHDAEEVGFVEQVPQGGRDETCSLCVMGPLGPLNGPAGVVRNIPNPSQTFHNQPLNRVNISKKTRAGAGHAIHIKLDPLLTLTPKEPVNHKYDPHGPLY